MPDLVTEYYYHCETAENWSTQVQGSAGNTYTVRWGREHKARHTVQHDWSCDCPAYRHKPGYCKHIQQVITQKLRCGWMQFINGGTPDNGKCPDCGGAIHSMGWAV
jgi:hypothetical protein